MLRTEPTFSKLIWCWILAPAVILGGIVIYEIIIYQTQPDIMSPENICRPVPENHNICGESVVDKNGIHSKYTYLILANGEYVLTDCLSNEYPRTIDTTEYACADGIFKTLNDRRTD